MDVIAYYIYSVIVAYGLVLGYLSARLPYFSHWKFALAISVLGPVTILAAIFESLVEVKRLHFRIFPLTTAERYVKYCEIYGFDYKDFNLFRQEYP